ncbi:pyrroloquinoline quinone precursor peptide PqqA [Neoroseomonas terrae]|nr:pyrroloquinoline quinone precursor peptide PqqA [Neoroseomonas terrae]
MSTPADRSLIRVRGSVIFNPVPAIRRPIGGGSFMAWKKPKIVEISLALEINSYACAEIG